MLRRDNGQVLHMAPCAPGFKRKFVSALKYGQDQISSSVYLSGNIF